MLFRSALKFYSTMRLDVRRVETIKMGDQILGNRTRVKIVKNKVAPPFKQAEFDIMYGQGISRSGDVLDCAVAEKIIEKSGSWYSYDNSKIGQGRENVKIYLESNPDIMQSIEKKLIDSLKNTSTDTNDEENTSNVTDMPPSDDDGVIIE